MFVLGLNTQKLIEASAPNKARDDDYAQQKFI